MKILTDVWLVVLDGYVRSYPRVQNEITGGNTEITGNFTIEEATDLANILKSGKLPAPAHDYFRYSSWSDTWKGSNKFRHDVIRDCLCPRILLS